MCMCSTTATTPIGAVAPTVQGDECVTLPSLGLSLGLRFVSQLGEPRGGAGARGEDTGHPLLHRGTVGRARMQTSGHQNIRSAPLPVRTISSATGIDAPLRSG
eukprot:9503864-Pyramimonas_sp.AAC.2